MYLTPSRYRAAGYGIDIPDDDAEVRAILNRASALIDAYCGVPLIPSRHSFSGGTITAEQHPWLLGSPTWNGTRRIYPVHAPLKDVTSFVVKFTNLYQVEIQPENLYVNHMEGWAEVVSLAAVVSGMYPVGINFGLYTPVAEIGYTYGYEFPVVGEKLYAVDGRTYQGGRGFWEADPVIYLNGVEQTTGFTLDLTEGEVIFDDTLAADDIVTADYTYTLPDAIVEATGITATHLLGEAKLSAKGMTGLSSIKVAEVALARTNRGALSLGQGDVIPATAASLLDTFVYRSVA